MSNSRIRQRLAAALPFREARQPKVSDQFFPKTYAWDNVTASQGLAGAVSATGAGGSSNGSQVLQSTLKEASDAVTQANKQLTDLQTAQQQLLTSTGANTQALDSNTAAKSGTGSSALSTAGSIAGSILGQGSLLSPIVSGLMSLFGGGSSAAQPVFTPYIAPPSVQLQTTVNSTVPAVNPPSPTSQNQGQSGSGSGSQVQIQVNAMDSKSFLDHSDEIANAVRQALLNSHSLGDVIAEL